MTDKRFGYVFVSFSREDREYVDKLLEAFDARNIKYWIETGAAGRSVRVIERKLEAATAVVVVMTPDAKHSRWVETELQYALSLGRPVVPLLLRGRRFFLFGGVPAEDVQDGALPSERWFEDLRALAEDKAALAMAARAEAAHEDEARARAVREDEARARAVREEGARVEAARVEAARVEAARAEAARSEGPPRSRSLPRLRLPQRSRLPKKSRVGPRPAAAASLVRELTNVEQNRIRRGVLPDAPAGAVDEVQCTVYAPRAIGSRDMALVQVLTHLEQDAEEAERQALQADAAALPRGVVALAERIARGSTLTFELRIPGIEIDDPWQSATWAGNPMSVQFAVTAPRVLRSKKVVGTVIVSIDSVPIGNIKFTLELTRRATEADLDSGPVGDAATGYEHAFISYASEDRPEVLKRVQMLTALGIAYFQDWDIEPGQRWEQELYRNIDRSDVLLLFWSQHAKQSKWVRREVRYALSPKNRDHGQVEIEPVLIEGPPVPKPWSELAHLHFGDRRLHAMRG